jgi:hypothetical protein
MTNTKRVRPIPGGSKDVARSFVVKINIEGDALETDLAYAIWGILERLAVRILYNGALPEDGKIFDVNGKQVGTAQLIKETRP